MRYEMAGVLPVPDLCHACASPNIRLYQITDPNKPESKGWLCDDCGAFVSCHYNSDFPVGYMARRQVRNLRRKLHILFDRFWIEKHMSRDDSYSWLARQLDVAPEQCHVSWLTSDQLEAAIVLCESFYEVLCRRSEKIIERKRKRHRRANATELRNMLNRRNRRG